MVSKQYHYLWVMKQETKETLGFPLRFKSKKQKSDIKKIAGKNGRSLNSEILHMVDLRILSDKSKGSHG